MTDDVGFTKAEARAFRRAGFVALIGLSVVTAAQLWLWLVNSVGNGAPIMRVVGVVILIVGAALGIRVVVDTIRRLREDGSS